MWLGILKHKKYFIQGLPKGYEISHEMRNVDRPRALPPIVIHYVQKHVRTPLDYLAAYRASRRVTAVPN